MTLVLKDKGDKKEFTEGSLTILKHKERARYCGIHLMEQIHGKVEVL
jgi:hypothetical protein